MRWIAANAHQRGILSEAQYHELLAVYRTLHFL
jgi:hypothetical protein